MKRLAQLVSVLLVSASIGACVSAKQRAQDQQELERSIRSTSNADAVKNCSFIMNLRPDGLHSTPEAQAASLVTLQKGVSWVVFGVSGGYQLYSCPQKPPQSEPEAIAPTPTPPPEKTPTAPAPRPVDAKTAPAGAEPAPEVVTPKRPPARTETPAPVNPSALKTRVTNNPEAVKGCKFLESFVQYQKVSRFQEDVVRAGGNLGYVVATNRDGDVIGESYLCSEEPKP